jgi:carboxypeptidase family protein
MRFGNVMTLQGDIRGFGLARRVFTMLCGWCFIGIYLFAQSGAGSIQGTITDSSGAVISQASVHVMNLATGVAVDTSTNEVGFYQVPGLFTGTYNVTITAPGMETAKAAVELQVAQAAVIDASLTAGTVTQEIKISAETIQLTTTDNGSITSTLENSRINQLPMNGRTLFTLSGETTPGVESASNQRVNGLMPEALEYIEDGAPMDNRNFGGESNSSQSQVSDPDAVQEVRMETTNANAQFAEPATGIITTKSGTNALHGSLFETARNNAIGIARARQNPTNFAAPHLVRNEYGASAGGPIILPHLYHGKDKSFWFLAYEKFSLASYTNELVSVPTSAMRSGDWSGLVNTAGVPQQLYDPATTAASSNCNGSGTANQYCRAPFPNNQIPIGRLAPATKILYDTTPLPNLPGFPTVQGNFQAPDIDNEQIPTITFRIDHSFSESNKVYLRFSNNLENLQTLQNYPANAPATIAADGLPWGVNGVNGWLVGTYSGAVGYTHIFSPNFYAETIVAQQWFNQYVHDGGSVTADYESKIGLPNNFGEGGFPTIGTGLVSPYSGNQGGYRGTQIISNIDENLSKTVGLHQLQFGGRYRHERLGYLPDRQSDTIAFGNYASALENPASGTNYTAAANTGYEDADFFLGAAASYNITEQAPFVHFHDMEFDAYFQDNYRITRNLTANIGLRYEAHPALWTKYGLAPSFDLKNDAMVLVNPTSYYVAHGYTTQTIINNMMNDGVKFETGQQAGYPTNTLLDNYDFNLLPRVGLAYQPFGSTHGTVVRGSYGRYIYPIPTRNSDDTVMVGLPYVASYGQNYLSAAQSPDGLPNYLLRAPQPIVMGLNSTNVVNSTTANSLLPGFAVWSRPPNYAPDFVTEVNATVEQSLKGGSALRLTWLWTHGTNLDHYDYYNAHPSPFVWETAYGIVPPTGGASTIGTNQYSTTAIGPYDKTTWGNNVWDVKNGWSNDNALQVNYQRLFHRGIAYQVMYVWSKPFRVGGNYFRDATIYPAADYLGDLGSLGSWKSPFGAAIASAVPPRAPAGAPAWAEYHSLDRFEAYKVDTAIPLQHIQFNGIVDLPFGRGKRFLGHANRFLDELVGGFQLAGDGSIISQDFQPTSSNWGQTNPLKTYKHKAKITDCRSGVCHESFLWFNGYIAPTANANSGFCNSNYGVGSAGNGNSKCVYGLPGDYEPYSPPIDNTPGTANYGTNNVQVTLLNGNVSTVPYSPGPYGSNPFSNTILHGPMNWTIDTSLFKVFPITDTVNLRFNLDAFNALNMQGYLNPNTTDGTESLLSSYNTPRQLQFTLRLTF